MLVAINLSATNKRFLGIYKNVHCRLFGDNVT